MSRRALIGARIFTGDTFLDHHALLLDKGKIGGLVPEAELPADIKLEAVSGLLVPGFIDAQVNGGGGILFNDMPNQAALLGLARAHARHGTTAMLPTYITDTPQGMALALAAAKAATGKSAVVGLHLEGPFLSLARKGAHDSALIRPLTDADVDLLLGAQIEHLLLTLAAENASPRLIRRLARGGVTVSLGHSDAAYAVVMAAVDAGARGITHLFNAMSPLQHRQPGMVGAALDHPDLWCGIIPDGHHVHPAVLRIALRAKRAPGRLFVVTDAMPTAGDAGDVFHLNGRKVTRKDGVLRLEDGTLAGSDLTMEQALAYVIAHLDVGLAEGLRMCSLYPAQFLRLDHKKGRIAAKFDADLVLLNEAMQVSAVWIGGRTV